LVSGLQHADENGAALAQSDAPDLSGIGHFPMLYPAGSQHKIRPVPDYLEVVFVRSCRHASRGRKTIMIADYLIFAFVCVKRVAPSTELRKWFSHDAARWEEFQRRYRAELDQHPEAWQPILDAANKGDVTLLFSSHDAVHNNAVALKDYLETKQRNQARR